MTLDMEVIVANTSGTPIMKDVDSYTTFASTEHCGPWPGICLFNVPQYDGLLFDPISSIEAFSVCMNGVRGDEDLYYRITLTENVTNVVPECNDTSNSSMLVFALGKRLEADSLVEQVDKSTRPQNYPTRESAVTNLHKVYTLTVGRLSWEAKDLATDIHAKCMSDADSKCFGLAYDLQNGKQKLLVSTEKLPLKQLNQQFRGEISFNGPKRLVEVVDTPAMSLIEPDPEFLSVYGNNILLPHNVETLEWNTSHIQNGSNCCAWVEDRLSSVLDNHFYIEHGLQTAYTAAMFFLFQDGVVRDVIPLSHDRESLDLDKSIRETSLLLSIPEQNVVMTISGALLLCLGAVAVVVYSEYMARRPESDPLNNIKMPHMIAQVLFDDGKYPSMVLHRRLTSNSEREGYQVMIGDTVVDSMALRSRAQQVKRLIELQEATSYPNHKQIV